MCKASKELQILLYFTYGLIVIARDAVFHRRQIFKLEHLQKIFLLPEQFPVICQAEGRQVWWQTALGNCRQKNQAKQEQEQEEEVMPM